MANVNEGLSQPGEGGLDPNNQRDFEKIMEGRGVAKEDGEGLSPSTDVRSGLTTAEPGQAREPESGKFVAKDTSRTGSDTSSTVPVVDEAALDPEVAAFLSKYDGDPVKALAAAASAQALIGRQGQELGQTREELAELRGLVHGLQAAQTAAPVVHVSDEQVESQAAELVGDQGYLAAATHAANVLVQTGDARLYSTVRDQWALEDPGAAMDFNTDFRMWQRDQAKPVTAPEAWQVAAAQDAKVKGIEASLVEIKADWSDEDWALIEAQMDTALGSMPKNVLAMVASDDAEARTAGTRLVVDRATVLARNAGPAAAAAAPTPQDPVVPASVLRKLAGAAVATGALKAPVKSNASPVENREDAIKEFKRQIVEAETTSVSSGLTYGPPGSR